MAEEVGEPPSDQQENEGNGRLTLEHPAPPLPAANSPDSSVRSDAHEPSDSVSKSSNVPVRPPAAQVTSADSCPALSKRLQEHGQWLATNGVQGRRFVLVCDENGAKVSEKDSNWEDLRKYQGASLAGALLWNADLRGGDLRGADLSGAKLQGADLTETTLWDADLTGADLTDVEGLRLNSRGEAHPLGGAILSGATVPSDLAAFPALGNIAELSQSAGKLFVSLVTADVVMQLLILRTTDVQLLTDAGTVKIPLIDTEMQVTTLFWLGPLVLLVLYVVFHLYLQRLWEMLAGLPAIFPDGMPVTQKTYPWLMNDIVRSEFPCLKAQRQPLSRAQELLFALLAYGMVSVTLVWFWARYLCRHDWRITWFHITCTGLFLWGMLVFFGLARATLRRDTSRLGYWRKPCLKRPRAAKARMMLLPLGIAMLCVGFFWCVSRYSIDLGIRHESLTARSFPQLPDPDPQKVGSNLLEGAVSTVLGFIRVSPFANFREIELSTKPDSWVEGGVPPPPHVPLKANGKEFADIHKANDDKIDKLHKANDDKIAMVHTGARLKDTNLRWSDLQGAFLVNADLRGADLSYAEMRDADLRGIKRTSGTDKTDFYRASLVNANLNWTDLTGLDLKGADLTGAQLIGAKLGGADLTGAQLGGADLRTADLRTVILTWAVLSQVDLSGEDLTGAKLIKANLIGADLRATKLDATDLTHAEMRGAVFTGAYYTKHKPIGIDVIAYHIVHKKVAP